jgi:hypothetical protein
LDEVFTFDLKEGGHRKSFYTMVEELLRASPVPATEVDVFCKLKFFDLFVGAISASFFLFPQFPCVGLDYGHHARTALRDFKEQWNYKMKDDVPITQKRYG